MNAGILEFVLPPRQEAAKIGKGLRDSSGRHLRHRRAAVALTLTSVASMSVIALYQLGILQRIPELPFPGFASAKVNASAEAYSHFSMPDGVLGLANYGATMALIAAGGKNREKRYPWLPIAAAAKVSLDAAMAAKLTVDEIRKQKAVCSWCLAASGATFVSLGFVWPEARAAIRCLSSLKKT